MAVLHSGFLLSKGRRFRNRNTKKAFAEGNWDSEESTHSAKDLQQLRAERRLNKDEIYSLKKEQVISVVTQIYSF